MITGGRKQKGPDQGRGFSLQLVPETGVEPATYALRIAAHAACHDLVSDSLSALTSRENRDLMRLQGQLRRV